MENLDPINVDFIINSGEVKRDADRVKGDISGVNDTAERAATRTSKKLKQVYDQSTKEVQEFDQAVKQSSASLQNQGTVAGRQRSQFNGLGNSINQITRELPAFTFSAQTGFLAISNNIPILVDEVNRLQVANKELNASGQKSVPVWKQVVKGLFSWQTALSVGVSLLTIYGKDIIDWAAKLFKAGETADEAALKVEAFNKAIDSTDYTSAITEVNELELAINGAREGLVDKEAVLNMYNEGIGRTSGSLRTFNELEQWQIDNSDKYLQFMFKKAQATAMLQLAIEKTTEAQKSFNDDPGFEDYLTGGLKAFGSGGITALSSFAEAQRAGRVVQLDKDAKQFFELYNKYQTDFQKYAAENGFDIFGDGTGEKTKQAISNRQRLLDQISALDKEYARKSFTKDEQEVQALKDKFARMREIILRFNTENKQNPIDITGLGNVEEQATEDLLYRQDTEKLKVSIADQKRLYEEYNQAKTALGIEEADKRYSSEIKTAQSYFDYLLAEYDKINQLTGKALTGAQQERLQFILGEIGKEKAVQEKQYDELLVSLRDYTTERELIVERHEERIRALLRNGDTDKITEANRQHQAEIDALDDANVKKLQSYKQLYDDTIKLTRRTAGAAIVEIRKLLESENMSEALRKDLLEKERTLKLEINKSTLDDIYKLSTALTGLGDSLIQLGAATGNAGIASLGGLLAGLATGVNDVLTVFDESASNADVMASGINGLVKVVNMLSQAAAQRRSAEEAYYRSLIGFQQQYNLSLNEQIRLQSQLAENVFIADYEGRIRDGVESLTDANRGYMEAIAELEDAYVKSGQRNQVDFGNIGQGVAGGAAVGAAVGSIVPLVGTAIGAVLGGLAGGIAGLFGGTKKVDNLVPLLEEYPELVKVTAEGLVEVNKELAEALVQNDLLSERSKELVNDVLEWGDAIEKARQQIKDVVKELVGSLGGDVRNALVESFKAGEDAAVRMGDTVEKVLENMVSQILFNSIFRDVFDQLQTDLEGSLAAGDVNGLTNNLGAFFTNAQGLSNDFNAALAQAQAAAKQAGFDIFNADTGNQGGLAGGIRREITEATGTELAGLFRGFYDISNRTLLTVEQQLTVDKQHYDATLTIMRSSAAIEQHTANAVAELKATVIELKAINKNTKQNSTGYDRGI